jgi:hypothetical protein
MKNCAAFLLAAVLGLSCLVPGYLEARTDSQTRDARKMEKKQAKAQKKYSKAQKKAEKKMLKQSKKNTHYPTHTI